MNGCSPLRQKERLPGCPGIRSGTRVQDRILRTVASVGLFGKSIRPPSPRSEQKIGPGRGNGNEPGVNEPANATPGQGTQFRNALEGRRNRTSQGGLFSPAPPLGRRNLFAQNLGLRSESRLPQANIPGSSGAEAPLLIRHLNPLHCKQRGILNEEFCHAPVQSGVHA